LRQIALATPEEAEANIYPVRTRYLMWTSDGVHIMWGVFCKLYITLLYNNVMGGKGEKKAEKALEKTVTPKSSSFSHFLSYIWLSRASANANFFKHQKLQRWPAKT
jgi:hypothetical protein